MTVTNPEDPSPSHVDALIVKYARGRSDKEIERQAGLNQGALGSHLKPSQRGRFPRLQVQQRFATALGAPLREVSNAFAADCHQELLETEPLPPDCQELVDIYLALEPSRRALARHLMRGILDQQRTEHPQRDPGQPPGGSVVDSTTRGTVDNEQA